MKTPKSPPRSVIWFITPHFYLHPIVFPPNQVHYCRCCSHRRHVNVGRVVKCKSVFSFIWLQDERESYGLPKEVDPSVHGVQLIADFNPVDHALEPTEKDNPVKCPQPQPCILHVSIFIFLISIDHFLNFVCHAYSFYDAYSTS